MKTTPWQQAKSQQKSRKQEERLANEEGGRRQINSGRLWHSKGDVRLGDFLVEARTTDKESYRLTVEDLKKIERQAANTGGMPLPAMQIDMSGAQVFVMRLTDHQEREARLSFLEDEVRRLRGRGSEISD